MTLCGAAVRSRRLGDSPRAAAEVGTGQGDHQWGFCAVLQRTHLHVQKHLRLPSICAARLLRIM